MDPLAAFRQRLRQPRPQRQEHPFSVHRLQLAFPDRAAIGRASVRAWSRLCRDPLSPAVSGLEPLWLSAAGDGVWLERENFGAMPGDGVDTHVHFLLPGDVHGTFVLGMDYSQRELCVVASGPAGAELEGVLSVMDVLAYGLRCRQPK